AVATVTNSTSEPFEVQRPQAGPGVWWGALVHPGTLDIVGWHTEPALYTAELKSSTAIDPGASLQVGVDIGRVACSVSSTTGTRIPTADYELVGFVTLPAGAAVRTSAVPVRVAAEPPSAAE